MPNGNGNGNGFWGSFWRIVGTVITLAIAGGTITFGYGVLCTRVNSQQDKIMEHQVKLNELEIKVDKGLEKNSEKMADVAKQLEGLKVELWYIKQYVKPK